MRTIGINYYTSSPLSVEEFAHEIKALGFGASFTGLLSDDNLYKVANSFAHFNISYETIHAPFDKINDIWLDGLSGDEMLSRLKITVDACHRFNIPIAVVHLSSGENAPSISDVGKRRFSDLIDHAERSNVKIAFENQRKLANIAWAFEEFKGANVGFCWDCGHEGCFTPGREYMPLFGNRIICTHIHDNPGIYNKDLHCIPFDGSLDYYRISRQIRESGYAGSLMLEVFPENSEMYKGISPTDFLERAAVAAKRLRDIVDMRS